MAAANAAFYARPDPLAAFVTAPELTQVFGELLGLWAGVVWEGMGGPEGLLCEAGPGRGTLMRDALRALGRVRPAFCERMALHFIETSPSLRARLASLFPQARFHERLEDLPPKVPLLLLANEFLDALPIRQFVFQERVWRERHVGPEGPILHPLPSPPPHPRLRAAAKEGDVLEWGEAREAFIAALARRLREGGGAALFIDYGPYRSGFGESLQAIAAGRPVPPFALPAGEADLTAHVDFAALARTAREGGVAVWGPIPQGVFLSRLGLFERTARLAAAAAPPTALALRDAAERLARPERMGALFKVLALSTTPTPPPGFAPGEAWREEGSVEGDVAGFSRRRDETGAAHDEEEQKGG